MKQSSTDSQVIVIGAGVAGLATASLLGAAGYQVTLVEKLDDVGGRVGELNVDGFRFETGPSWYLMAEAFEHYFNLLGTTVAEHVDLVRLDPGYRIIGESGEVIDVPGSAEGVQQLCESLEPGAGKRIGQYLESARRVYDIALDQFLYTTFSSISPLLDVRVRQHLLELIALLGTSLDRYVDKRFQHPRIRQMLKYPAVFLSSEPKRIPALYHLMSHTDLEQGVYYPRGGFRALIDAMVALCEARGVRIELSTQVTAILSEDRKVSGVRVRGDDGATRIMNADIVVGCGDLQHLETSLLPAHQRTFSRKFFARRDPGLSTVLVLLGVRGRLPQLWHHNLLFSDDWEPDFEAVYDGASSPQGLRSSQSIYVCKASETDDTLAPEGDENLFILVPVPADPTIGHGDSYHDQASGEVSAIAEAAVKQLARWANIPDLVERIVVKKTLGPADFVERYFAQDGGAIGPAHTLNQSALFRAKNKSDKLAGLYYAGATTQPGVGVPMCLISAENVLKRLRGDTSASALEKI